MASARYHAVPNSVALSVSPICRVMGVGCVGAMGDMLAAVLPSKVSALCHGQVGRRTGNRRNEKSGGTEKLRVPLAAHTLSHHSRKTRNETERKDEKI